MIDEELFFAALDHQEDINWFQTIYANHARRTPDLDYRLLPFLLNHAAHGADAAALFLRLLKPGTLPGDVLVLVAESGRTEILEVLLKYQVWNNRALFQVFHSARILNRSILKSCLEYQGDTWNFYQVVELLSRGHRRNHLVLLELSPGIQEVVRPFLGSPFSIWGTLKDTMERMWGHHQSSLIFGSFPDFLRKVEIAQEMLQEIQLVRARL